MCRTETGERRAARGEWNLVGQWLPVFIGVGCLVLMSGCTDKGSFQAMAQQPRYEALENSDFYADQSSALAPQADTVARGELRDDPLLFTGKVNGQVVDTFPFAITGDVLLRGQQRFNIYCAPCHDMAGGGNGPVVRAGFPHPPSFHEQRLRDAPAGHYFCALTACTRRMP